MSFFNKVLKWTFIFLLFYNPSNINAKEIERIPNEINMNISWKSLKRYFFYIDKIKKSFRTDIIKNKYKKKFSSRIFFASKGEQKVLPANARITGHILDHVDVNKNLSSFKIELEKGNINNITKFRLLTDSKSVFDEIFWSILIREMGYPSSYRGLVNSKINGVDKKYFFEESYAKEFIERIGYRYSPVLEMDDRELFHNISQQSKCYNFGINGYQKNKSCIEKLKKIKTNNVYKIENKSFIQNPLTAQIAYSAIVEKNKLDINNQIINGFYDKYNNINKDTLLKLKTKILKLQSFKNFNKFASIHSLYGAHSLNNYNEKFIYDPMYNELIPVNWDSNIILSDKCIKREHDFEKKFLKDENLKKSLKKISFRYTEISKAKLTNEMKCLISIYLNNESIYENTGELIYFTETEKTLYEDLLNNKTKDKFPIVKINTNFTSGTLCYSILKCENIDFLDIKNVLGGDYEIVNKPGDILFPYIYLGTDLNKNKISYIVNDDQYEVLNIKVASKTTIYFYLKNGKKLKKINIFLENPNNSKFVIYNSVLNNININMSSSAYKNDGLNYSNQIRHDEMLLTGCLNILNSKFTKLKVNVENSSCEDAVNFIRSKGDIKNINVIHAKFDGIDADSSNIVFENINVQNARNDCLDFSFGNYKIKKLMVKNCSDKGLSVGEKSKVDISEFNSINTNLSFVSKDNSVLTLNQFNSDIDDSSICGKTYKKKQEFDGAKIFLKQKINCKIHTDKYSEIKFAN